MTSVAVAVAVAVAVNGGDHANGSGSRRAVRWAAENLLPEAQRFILVHVIPAITSVPTPSGARIPVEALDENVVALYVEEVKAKTEEIFVPFKKLCNRQKVETVVLEDDNPASALLNYASESGISSLVLGSWSPNCIIRKLKGPGIPLSVLNSASLTCDIFVISKTKIFTKSIRSSSISEVSSRRWLLQKRESMKIISRKPSDSDSNPSTIESNIRKPFDISSAFYGSISSYQTGSTNNGSDMDMPYHHLGDSLPSFSTLRSYSVASTIPDQHQPLIQDEIEKLRHELQNAVSLYKQACEELVHTQSQIELISSEYVEDARKANAALEREEKLRKIADEEREAYMRAKKEVEEAKTLLAKEVYERKMAELRAYKESLEKQRLVDELFLSDKRYRRYTMNEIELATDNFSKSKIIGEGGYGEVYKCNLNHTPVAIKVLSSDTAHKKQEFLREIEVLSQLRHPHLVLLLGACPESGCLVYEYLENGSLEDFIYKKTEKSPLPWFVRFRVAFEVACGLAFLHNAKPEPIVHRDIKPGNILLDRNYVSKIGDVGLAKLMSEVVPDNITEYRDSTIAGTLCYLDPEYQRTGTIRPKSDLYAFGVVVLQLLTGQRPNGLVFTVEKAIKNGRFAEILDGSVTDWPLVEAEQLAEIALKCLKLRCRDRPDLDTEVLPVLKRLVDVAGASVKVEGSNSYAPSHYFCPILQEIMDDPYIAADGFSYEHRAIKAWLERHTVSPVTKLRLQHSTVTPNHTLKSAIQQWKSNLQSPLH